MHEIVSTGEWLYDGTAPMPVHVVRQDYDFWYELGKVDDQLEPGETPNLNSDGVAYYVVFNDPQERPWWVESHGFDSIADAQQWAEAQLPSPVRWQPRAV